MVTIDRERLISEKRNNKASAEGARLPKEAMLLRDIYKFIKPSLDTFRALGHIVGLICLKLMSNHINLIVFTSLHV